MANRITYTDKQQGQVNTNPVEKKFTFGDANEIKTVVNSNADDIEANATTLNTLDGTNIELIKGGGIFIDDAIVALENQTGSDIDWDSTSGVKIDSKLNAIDSQVLTNSLNKVELGGDIGGTVSVPVINNQAITNAKLANMPTNRFKGRVTSGNGEVEDLTVPQTKTALSIDQVDNTSDLDKPISTATAAALNTLDFDLIALDNAKINKNVGTTYTTNALTTVTQAEYDGLTPDASTIYFIV